MTKETATYVGYLSSPVGWLEIKADTKGITQVYFQEEKNLPENPNKHVEKAIKEFNEYFAGKREKFTVKLNPTGTDFQKKVWDELLKIPFGRTTSYFDLSNKLGDVKAIRAVGTANGKNPIAIIVPCHRVVGRDGSLTGYAGGLERKKWLINFEQQFEQKTLFDE